MTDLARVERWRGGIDLEYRYTAGIAGEKFFRELKLGRLLASRCEWCKLCFLPPRIYCERCFRRIENLLPVNGEGTLYSYTAIDGRNIYGLIKFEGVKGGLLGRVDGRLSDLSIGMKVKVRAQGTEIIFTME